MCSPCTCCAPPHQFMWQALQLSTRYTVCLSLVITFHRVNCTVYMGRQWVAQPNACEAPPRTQHLLGRGEPFKTAAGVQGPNDALPTYPRLRSMRFAVGSFLTMSSSESRTVHEINASVRSVGWPSIARATSSGLTDLCPMRRRLLLYEDQLTKLANPALIQIPGGSLIPGGT